MRYVAIGDSFTEGVGDERADGTPRGWADRVAEGLAAHHRPADVWYANLAVRGRLLAPIATEQLDAALALDPAPTIVTINGGGNDVMRPGADVARLGDLTAQAVDRCLAAGVTPVVLAGPDPSDRLPFGRALRRRAAALTDVAAALARDRGLTFVNVFADAEIRRPRYWSDDRLHLNPVGHQRVATLVLAALGAAELPSPPAPPSSAPVSSARLSSAPVSAAEAPPPPSDEEASSARRRLAEAGYYWRYVRPWVARRLTGRSSGDGRAAKHPAWVLARPAAD